MTARLERQHGREAFHPNARRRALGNLSGLQSLRPVPNEQTGWVTGLADLSSGTARAREADCKCNDPEQHDASLARHSQTWFHSDGIRRPSARYGVLASA